MINRILKKIFASFFILAIIGIIGCNRGQFNNKPPYHPGIRVDSDDTIINPVHDIDAKKDIINY